MTARTRRGAQLWATGVLFLIATPGLLVGQASAGGDGTGRNGEDPAGVSRARASVPLGVELVAEEEQGGSAGQELAYGLVADPTPVGFLERQLRFPRVRRAFADRRADVDALFEAQGVARPAELFFRVFKREQLLEVWARGGDAGTYVLLNTYPVCGTSGELGPKRSQGDEQIPEGFYSIDLFNPTSNFHLSLRVDYPNAVDRARRHRRSPGGDIFIHGGCATIGCVPVTDRWIEEIYIMAVDARHAGQERIPVHMFPTRLDADGMAWLYETYGTDHADLQFWLDLRLGYLAFERTRTVPAVEQHRGRYLFPMGDPVAR